MNHLWRIELFGGLRVVPGNAAVRGGGTGSAPRVIERFRTQKTAALLAYLAFHPRPHARELLIELFWPEHDLQTGRQNLRTALSSLRRQLEPPGTPQGGILVASRALVQLHPRGITTDVAAFEEALHEAKLASRDNERIAAYELAVEYYRGPLLSGFYDDWIAREAQRLEDDYSRALLHLIAFHEMRGDFQRALYFARQGARYAAERDEFAAMLERLSACEEPSRESGVLTPRALKEIPKKETSRSTSKNQPERPLNPNSASSISTRLISASSASMPSAQAASFPDARLHARTPLARESLPPQFTRFFGREAEIQAAREEFCNRGTRLLTLTGPGGAGKTRLAIEIARHLLESSKDQTSQGEYSNATQQPPGGKARRAKNHQKSDHDANCGEWPQAVYFVPLADVGNARLIAGAILDVLSSDTPQPFAAIPPQLAAGAAVLPEAFPLADLCAALPSRSILLILDNFEHLVESAPILEMLLSHAPQLKLLLTSQHRLNVPGERELPVAPLPIPALPTPSLPARIRKETLREANFEEEAFKTLAALPSVQLFVDRAQSARPDFGLTRHNAQDIAVLCAHLEGIPLAIELAAARAGVLSPSQIASQIEAAGQRLDFLKSLRRPETPRHASLRTAIAWSYSLLPPDLARFWTQLSVFRNGFTAEAAQAVCREPSALHFLAQLRASSLVSVQEHSSMPGGATTIRFRLLEMLREFAASELSPKSSRALATRHAEYFCDALADGVLRLRTPAEATALAQSATEVDNARAALDWARRNRKYSLAGALALSLGTTLHRRGLHREALEHIETGLDCAEKLPDVKLADSKQLPNQSSEKIGDTRERASSSSPYDSLRASLLRERAGLHLDQLQWPEAREAARAMLEICRCARDEKGMAEATNLIGLAAKGQKQWKQARRHLTRALNSFARFGDTVGEANAHNNLGLVEYMDEAGNKEAAATYLREALKRRWTLNDARGVAETFINLGALAQGRGDMNQAGQYYSEALAMELRLGHVFGVARALCNLGEVAESNDDLEGAFRFYCAAQYLFESGGAAYQNYSSQQASRLAAQVPDASSIRDTARRLAGQGALVELASWTRHSL